MTATPVHPGSDPGSDPGSAPGWRLRRGVAVVARPDGLVQVGSDPGRRVLLRHDDRTTSLLASLARGSAEPADPVEHDLLVRLGRHGLVVDESEVSRSARARAETRVLVLGPEAWCRKLVTVLEEEGLLPVTPAERDGGVDVTVLLSAGEPGREELDRLSHGGDPLLTVAVVDARLRLGPFVLPGSTACLRCVDAHLAVRDPARTVPASTAPGSGAEVSPRLLRHGLGRAGADLSVWAEGRRPATWSTTTWVDEDLVEESQPWRRHPHCGCSWGDLLLLG